MAKKIGLHVFVIALLFPLLFINIRNSQDWGDDFAQYIHQARNILIGESQNNTGYIYNENYFIGPKAYPTGFPLLLAAFSQFGNDGLEGLSRIISAFWLLACFVGFLILRKHHSFLTALITTIIIAYNPMMINFKTEILSDLPFTFFSMLCLYLIDKEDKPGLSIASGLLLAFTVHIRTIGFILLGVHCFYKFIKVRKADGKNPYRYLIMTLSAFFVLYFALKLIYPCDSCYPGLFDAENYWLNMNKQISYNFDTLFSFFRSHPIKNFYYIPVIASSCMIAFSFIGLIKFWKTDRTNPIVIYTIAYIFVIISFKFGDTWMRFLFPILFIIFLLAIEGLKVTFNALNISGRKLAVVFGAFILFGYSEELERIVDHTSEINEGPQKPAAQKMFEYINENLDQETVVEFDKPRALALYTNVRSVAFNPLQEKLNIPKEVVKFDVNYILTYDLTTDPVIRNFTQQDTAFCKMVYSVNEFRLYKLNP
jgi:hypothetical protein